MVSGEEILGDVERGAESVTIKDPVIVVIVGEGKLALVPWIPLSVEPEVAINNRYIVTSYEPNEQLIKHYRQQTSGIQIASANQLPPNPPNFGK